MRAYIPDFSYKVVRIHDYTNEELRKHEDVMSLLLMFNRIQSPEDYSEFIRDSKEYLSKMLVDTPQELMDVLLDVFWALLMKMNVPQEEAQELVENMGVKEVGYLFENAEKMDIQAERRNTKKAQERAEAAEKKVETAEKEKARMCSSLRNMMGRLAGLCKAEGLTKEETRNRLHDFYQVNESDLETYFEDVWNAATV